MLNNNLKYKERVEALKTKLLKQIIFFMKGDFYE